MHFPIAVVFDDLFQKEEAHFVLELLILPYLTLFWILSPIYTVESCP